MDINVILQLIKISVMSIGVVVAVRQLALLTKQIQHQSKQIQTQSKQIQNRYEWSTRQFALTYSITRNSRLREARIKLDEAFGIITSGDSEALTQKQIDEAIEKDPSIYTDISYLLAHWENMALAIRTKVVNEEVAFEMVGGMVITYVEVFRNFIEDRRKINPKAYDYLLTLNKEWEDRLNGVTRPQFSNIYYC